jgi:3-(3-hydroxy-phenyl)propionate hydroxylase
MKYKPKPHFDAGFLARAGENGTDALVGTLFPQPTVRSKTREALLDDFLGDGFALLALPQTPADLFNRLPSGRWESLNTQRVAIRSQGDSARSPEDVTTLVDEIGDFTRATKNLPPGLLVLRPDRYVAAYLSAENMEAGMRNVDELIRRT